MNQFKIEFNNLREIFEANKELKTKCLRGVSNSNNDGNSGIQDSSLAALRQEIYRFSDFIFSGNPNDRQYFLGKGVDSPATIISKYGCLKPCIHGSDAHSMEKICVPDLERFTFIKADTSFDGLKQIVCEPEYRVKIAKEAPISPPIRINKVVLSFPDNSQFENGNFCFSGTKEVVFSPNLTCIIGGRGSGKSTLLNLIHEKLRPGENDFFAKRHVSTIEGDKAAILEYVTIDDDTDEKYVEFISQNQVEEFAVDLNKLTSAIYNRIQKRDEAGILHKAESELAKQVSELKGYIRNLGVFEGRVKAVDQVLKEIETYKKIVESFSSDEYSELAGQVKTLSQSLTNLLSAESRHLQLLSDLELLITNNRELSGTDLYSSETNRIVEEIDKILKSSKAKDFAEVEGEKIALGDSLKQKQDELREYLKGRGLTEENLNDISSANIAINNLESDLERRNNEIASLAARIDSFQLTNVEAASRFYISELQRHADAINEILLNLTSSDVKTISLKFELDEEAVKQSIFDEFKLVFESQINQSNHKGDAKLWEVLFSYAPKEDIYKDILIDTIQNYYSTSAAKPFLIELLSNNHNFDRYRLLCKKNFLDYIAFKKVKLQYDNRPIEVSSFGQRCTAILVSLLVLGNTPLIIDEPEAHLDSLLISNYLVELIKEKKQNRQIIFATHNANLVLNGDAELIYILETDKNTGTTTVTPTTIENESTRKVLIGLEGGREAFRKRETKYCIE